MSISASRDSDLTLTLSFGLKSGCSVLVRDTLAEIIKKCVRRLLSMFFRFLVNATMLTGNTRCLRGLFESLSGSGGEAEDTVGPHESSRLQKGDS